MKNTRPKSKRGKQAGEPPGQLTLAQLKQKRKRLLGEDFQRVKAIYGGLDIRTHVVIATSVELCRLKSINIDCFDRYFHGLWDKVLGSKKLAELLCEDDEAECLLSIYGRSLLLRKAG
jgi:hypothetical protein